MFKLLGVPTDHKGLINSRPEWVWCKSRLEENMNITKNFFNNRTMIVEGTHILVKLIYSLSESINMPADRYFELAKYNIPNLSSAFKVFSEYKSGYILNSYFYNKDTLEILFLYSDFIQADLAVANWRMLKPVKVFRHPRSDLRLNILDGNVDTSENEGIAVIGIDLPKLALMYYGFRKEEQIVNSISKRTIGEFVHMYVLPNMLHSHLDYALFNRMLKLEYNEIIGESYTKNSFYVPNYDDKITNVQLNILTYLENRNGAFLDIAKNIPMVYNKNGLGLFTIPDLTDIRYVKWIKYVMILPYLMFLYKIANANGKSDLNTTISNRLKRSFDLLERDNVLNSALPSMYSELIYAEIALVRQMM